MLFRSWLIFHKWQNHEELKRNYNIIVYPRRGHVVYIDPEYPNIRSVNAPLLEVSSTFIRDALNNGKNMRYFMTSKVYELVKSMGLYSKA